MSLNRNQVAGHLGAANNPQVSSSQQHAARQGDRFIILDDIIHTKL